MSFPCEFGKQFAISFLILSGGNMEIVLSIRFLLSQVKRLNVVTDLVCHIGEFGLANDYVV